nr:HlyD family secretion protein [Gammaproteobacteria bacterium]
MKGFFRLLNISAKRSRWLVLVIILALFVWLIYALFIANPYTTDAFVQGDWLQVAARVNGPVVKIFVLNNQVVKKGEPLFEIDPTTYQLQVHKAAGDLQAINQELDSLTEEIKVAKYLIAQRKAELYFAYLELKRFAKLSREGAVSIERFNRAQADYNSLYAQVAQAEHQLAKLRYELGSLIDNGKKKAAIAALKLAEKNLSYTTVRAKVDGIVSNFYIRKGQYINIGDPVFSLVEADHWWIQANYLEWELGRIKPGQKATVRVSIYPTHNFKGRVTAIGPGISRGRVIGMQTQLPKVKESINWLRLFSRFPVFIDVTDPNPKYPLLVGATAVVIVH